METAVNKALKGVKNERLWSQGTPPTLLKKPDAQLLQTTIALDFLAFLFQVVPVLSLETFVTIKAEVPFKEKGRQRNEL